MEILRIPYMDDYGKINVDGNSKVVLTVLRSSEDVSYTLKTNHTFHIGVKLHRLYNCIGIHIGTIPRFIAV